MILEDEFQVFFSTFQRFLHCQFTTLAKNSRHTWSHFGVEINIYAAIKLPM